MGCPTEKFKEKLSDIVSHDTQESLLESFFQRHPSTFRADTLKIAADELEKNFLTLA